MNQRDLEVIKFDDIQLNVGGFENCRKAITDYAELKESIRRDGLLTPLTVWFREEEPKRILISGHKRYTSILDLRAETPEGEVMPFNDIIVVKYEGALTRALALNIIENVQREDLNPADRAEAVHALVDRFGTQVQVAASLNKSQPWVSQQCKLVNNLIPEVFIALRNTQVTLRQALAISQFVNKAGQQLVEKQLAALDEILHGKAPAPAKLKTFRTKKEIQDLRVCLSDNEDDLALDDEVYIDEGHKSSLNKVLRWLFMEIGNDELLRAPDVGEEQLVIEEATTKERQRV
jgi:ParB/RepB/Spo0J family partition protein